MLTIIHSQKATTKKEPKEIPYTFSKTLLKMRKPRTKKTPKKEQRANAPISETDPFLTKSWPQYTGVYWCFPTSSDFLRFFPSSSDLTLGRRALHGSRKGFWDPKTKEISRNRKTSQEIKANLQKSAEICRNLGRSEEIGKRMKSEDIKRNQNEPKGPAIKTWGLHERKSGQIRLAGCPIN